MSAFSINPLDALPHRDPFLFVSALVQLSRGVDAHGTWDVTGSEWFFAGHFPGEPIVPGVLICEALAQLAGLVAFQDVPRAGRLARVDVKLLSSVRPPATIDLYAHLIRAMGPLFLFEVSASCAQHMVAKGSLSLSEALVQEKAS